MKRLSFWKKAGAAFARLWALWLVGFLVLTLPPILDAPKNNRTPSPEDVPQLVQPATPPPTKPRPGLQSLQNALHGGDDGALLEFFRRRGLEAGEREHVQSLIDRLGAEQFAVRCQASAALEILGPRTASLLRHAVQHPDAEVRDRAHLLLQKLVQRSDVTLLTRAVRRLVQSRPAGAVAVLLHYLPDTEDDALSAEIWSGLTALTPREGPADPALVRALSDPAPERRAVAAIVLSRLTSQEHRTAIRGLHRDPDPAVRYHVAFALLTVREKAALPVMIELLPVLPLQEAWAVIDVLYQVAGTAAPVTVPGMDPEARRQCRDAWMTWWKSSAVNIDLNSSYIAIPGSEAGSRATLLVLQQDRPAVGFVMRVAADGRVEKDLYPGSLTAPVWAEDLPGGGLLVVDHAEGLVLERGLSGEVIWNARKPLAVFAQRLRSGNTFIACRDALWEVDRYGKTVAMISWPARSIATARRCASGRTLVLTDTGTCLFLDERGKETSRFETGCTLVLAPGIEVTANERILVPDVAGNRVVEFSPAGEILWSLGVSQPTSVQRLAGGSTLVSSTTTRRVQEFDRMGRLVWGMPLIPQPGSPLPRGSRPLVARRA